MTIDIRRDIEANWRLYNPILAKNELCYDITNNKYKIGNGVDSWNKLNYIDLNYIDFFIIRGIEGIKLQINMK